MRTTFDLDDELLRAAQARFPAGTPKTVILEEALHCLLRLQPQSVAPVRAAGRDPRMDRLLGEGLVVRATAIAAPEVGPHGAVAVDRLLADLARDREDR